MWKTIPLVAIMCIPGVGFTQAGVYARHLIGASETIDAYRISQSGLQISVEYGFRHKKKRLEFHPGLGYRFMWRGDYDGYFQSIDFDFNASIYPFDFGGDCDCPTFSKDGDLVKKGFFFELQPGVGYQFFTRTASEPESPTGLPVRSSNMIWKAGIAAGLDIGFSEQLTLTPVIAYTRVLPAEWDGLLPDSSSGRLNDQAWFSAGLRLAYKADPRKRRRF